MHFTVIRAFVGLLDEVYGANSTEPIVRSQYPYSKVPKMDVFRMRQIAQKLHNNVYRLPSTESHPVIYGFVEANGVWN
jgi:hypothetical protein